MPYFYADLVKDFRSVVNDLEPRTFRTIRFRKNRRVYKILSVSIFDPGIDSTANALIATSREFKDNPSTYLNLIRCCFCKLVVTVRGKPKWIIEPRLPELLKYFCDTLHIESHDDLRKILLEGALPIFIGGNPESLKKEVATLKHRLKSSKTETGEARSSAMRLADKVGMLQRDLESLREKYWSVCNPQLL